MLKLLIAIDGSAQSLRAIEVVGRWVRAGAPFAAILMNVRPPSPSVADLSPVHAGALSEAQMRSQSRGLKDAESRALGCGVPVLATLAVAGAPAQEIVRAASEQGADQIVMGAHGADALGGGSLVPGSVAQRVLCLARHPVLLVP